MTIIPKPYNFLAVRIIPEWKASMQCEYDALMQNGTMEILLKLNNGKVIGHKQVFRTKHQPNMSLDKYKSKVLAKGFQKTNGINYTETFGLIIKPTTITCSRMGGYNT